MNHGEYDQNALDVFCQTLREMAVRIDGIDEASGKDSFTHSQLRHFHRFCQQVLGKVSAEQPIAHRPYKIMHEAATQLCGTPSLLGPIYEHIIGRETRHTEGQFFTPPTLARLMADALPQRDAGTVLDPAAGGGALLAAVKQPIRRLGVEKDPLCADMARAGSFLGKNAILEIHTGDFLAETSVHSKPDLIICNPPYVRHHLIPPSLKDALSKRSPDRYGIDVSRLSCLSVYFMLEALHLLKQGGTAVFLTSADYLDAAYGKAIRQTLSSQFDCERIELLDPATSSFDGVLTTSAITVVHKSQVKRKSTLLVDHTTSRGRQCPRTDLAELENWKVLFPSIHARYRQLIQTRKARLGDYVELRRGTASGANSFFVLSQSEVDKWQIPDDWLRPVISSAKYLEGPVFTQGDWEAIRDAGHDCWLFSAPEPTASFVPPAVESYLNHGISLGVSRRPSCRARTLWYQIERISPPDIIGLYMTRGEPRFIENRTRCQLLSVFLNIYVPKKELIPSILEELRAPETKQLLGLTRRVYSGGLGKTEPGLLRRLPIRKLNSPNLH